jgi:hypothetical protein
VAVKIAAPAARWLVGLVAVLLFVASSRLPVQSSTVRFGSHQSKKSKSCPAESSVTSLPAASAERTGGFVKGHSSADRQSSAESTFRGISQVVESRLLVGFRRPDYLNSFASSSAYSDLPPPRA